MIFLFMQSEDDARNSLSKVVDHHVMNHQPVPWPGSNDLIRIYDDGPIVPRNPTDRKHAGPIHLLPTSPKDVHQVQPPPTTRDSQFGPRQQKVALPRANTTPGDMDFTRSPNM